MTPQRSCLARFAVIVALSVFAAGGGPASTQQGPPPSAQQGKVARFAAVAAAFRPGPRDVLLAGAGDIARCGRQRADAVATGDLIRALLATSPRARAFTAGDDAYEDGTAKEFRSCYDPAWGSFNDRTLPAPGNHEYHSRNARPYFDYFHLYRAQPAARQRGFYSVDLGGWHFVSLNSGLPMGAASPQVRWLEEDLRRTTKGCILAVWHHPRFSSGEHGAKPQDPGRQTGALWATLERHGADLVVNGHDHGYERFAPQDRDGRRSPRGIREIVAGTGGAELRRMGKPRPNSEVREDRHHGVLVLTLHPKGYSWAFLDTDGTVRDRSAAPVACHDDG